MAGVELLLAAILSKLDRGNPPDPRWPDGKGEYWALCPNPEHGDTHVGSFSVSDRGFCCHSCGYSGSLAKLAQDLGVSVQHGGGRLAGCTLQEYADAKRLPVGFLRSFGLEDGVYRSRGGQQTPCVDIPYRDAGGPVTATRKRTELYKRKNGKDYRFRWVAGSKLSLYGLWRLSEIRAAGWALLVEGESDCHTAWLYGLPVLGVPGASNWKAEWKTLLDGLDVYAWQEPDGGGVAFVTALERKGLAGARGLKPPDGVKDLSDAHIQGRDVAALVESLKADARPLSEIVRGELQTLADLAPQVSRLLHDQDLPLSRDKYAAISELLSEWLVSRHRLLVDGSQDPAKGGRPYLVADDGAVWPLEKDAIAARLALSDAGLNGTEAVYNFVLESIIMAAYKRGQRTTLARWQAARDGALYVSCGPCHIVRADGVTLTKLPNGSGGVWFAGDAAYPAWEPGAPTHPRALAAFNPPLEAPAEVPSYTPETQRALLAAWLVALLSGLRPLPLLVAIGRKGGGKSTLVRAMLRALLGLESDLTLLSDDRKDFWTQVTTSPATGLDNVDGDPAPWLADALAATVTGARIEARELYTNSVKLSRPITAALMVTTRTAAFVRPDIAERTLPVLTTEFTDDARVADSDLLAQVDAARNGLLSWAALTASQLLAMRHEAPTGLPLRFVDFARLFWAYMRVEGQPERAAAMLYSLRQAQSLTVGDADPLIQALLEHFDAIASDDGYWQGSASDLISALKTAAGAVGGDLPFLGGGKRVANGLRESRATLELLGISMKERSLGPRQRSLFVLQRASDAPTSAPDYANTQSTQTTKVARGEVGDNPNGELFKTAYFAYLRNDADAPAPTGAPAPGLPEDYCGPAVWHHKDYDELVTVTGFLGAHSGEWFFSVEGSATGAPGSELEASKADALAIANAEQAPTAPTGAPDADALADAVLSVRPLVAMLSSGPMQLDVFGEFAINNHARPDLVEAAALECGAMIYECDGVRWVALA